METEVRDQLEAWRSETAGGAVQSAQHVQDRLLDIYGAVRSLPVKSEVERWLTLTQERSMFEVDEIAALIADIETDLALLAMDRDASSATIG